MKFLHPYRNDPRISAQLGQFELYRLEAAAEETAAEPCPFCGGAAALGITFTYTEPAVYIECPSCHIKTAPYPAGYDFVQRRQMTLSARLKQAAETWNRRAG